MNHTILYPEFILFWGTNTRSVTQHQHPAVQLVIGVDTPFLSKNKEGKWVACPNLLVAPNHAHECDASGIEILSIIIEQESLLGESITQGLLQDQPSFTYPPQAIEALNVPLTLQLIQSREWLKLHQLIVDFFTPKKAYSLQTVDKRIQQVLQHIKNHLQTDITSDTLTEIACLSESRLLHLFKAQVGLPIRNFILWCRIKAAFELMMQDKHNLTQIAYEVGFADAAHMTRTFQKVLGIPPSMITKNSKFVQVFLPELI